MDDLLSSLAPSGKTNYLLQPFILTSIPNDKISTIPLLIQEEET